MRTDCTSQCTVITQKNLNQTKHDFRNLICSIQWFLNH